MVQDLEVYLYDDHRLIDPTRTEMLHRSFCVLTELFEWVGLHMNVPKMVSMMCRP